MTLQTCTAALWSPRIGDPDLTGWLTVAAYVLTACLSGMVWWRLSCQPGRLFWGILVVVLAGLAVNKQLDLQSALTAMGKCLATAQGWYADRRAVQAIFIGVLLSGIAIGLVGAMLMLRGTLLRNLLALLGLVTVLSFVMVRAVSIHRFDYLIGSKSLGLPNNFLFENSGLLLISINALMLLRPFRDRRPV